MLKKKLAGKIAAQWHPTKNGDLTPSDITSGSGKRVHWKCYDGKWPDGTFADDHEWDAPIKHRTVGRGRGCPCCVNKKIVPSNCLATTHPELIKEWHPTKNGDLTPNDVVVGSAKRVHWKCYDGKWPDGTFADDHEWETGLEHRKNGHGCPYCSSNKVVPSNCLATTHPELVKEWHPTKNGDLTPNDINGSNKKVHWKCYDGKWPDGTFADDHEWETVPSSRTSSGTGCPCCSNKKTVPSNCLATTRPKLIKEWHPTKNGDLTPSDITSGSGKRVHWKCYDGKWPDGTFADDHEWVALPSSRTSTANTGCPCCVGKKTVPSNCLSATHPKLIKEWHPTKNGDLTPSDITSGAGNRVHWKCYDGKWPDGTFADDHEWISAIRNRTSTGNTGCSICANQKTVLSNCLATTHPELVAQWHPTKNGDLTPSDITAGSSAKVHWKCYDGKWPDGTLADDHEWDARPFKRAFAGRGCPCCSGNKTVLSTCFATTHPELVAQWHPTLNGNLTPNDTTYGSDKKYWWKCSKNHVYPSSPGKRSIGRGCPTCKESRGEKKIRLYLKYHRIINEGEYRFKTSTIKTQRFDFATKLGVIEYQGIPHYRPVSFGGKDKHAKLKNLESSIKRDHSKLQWCKKHNVPLLTIPYWDYDRISEILDDFFAGKTPTFSKPSKVVNQYKSMRKRIRKQLKIEEDEVLCGLINS